MTKTEYNKGITLVTLVALEHYRDDRLNVGGFLRACLANDFVAAACLADKNNAHNLPEIARWIHNKMPADAWGSYERVDRWLAGLDEKGGEE